MTRALRLVIALGVAAPCSAVAAGSTVTIDLATVQTNRDVHWKVSEVTNGQVVVASPTYGLFTYGGVAGFTIPFTNNDGYWTAHATFTLPPGAESTVLSLQSVGVDDRVVVLLNGHVLTDAGTTAAGDGYMTYKDSGPNQPRTFSYASGPQNLTFRSGFVSGVNTIQAVINNTNEGILGVPLPVGPDGPSSFGLTGTVTYTTP